MESELELAIAGLVSLGYSYEIALKSTSVTQSSDVNKNVEWIQAHLEDPEIKALLQPQSGSQQQTSAAMEIEKNQPQQGINPEGATTEVKEGGEAKPDEPKWAPISDLVDKALVEQLNGMGFSKNVAEKALFFTQEQKSIEAALAWTESHQDDDDYEEALMMQVGGENKPKLSEAEAKQKARELQAKLREDRKKREQQDEFEKEKRRIMSGRSMGDAQRDIQELKQRQDALQLKRQREQDAIDKQKILDQLQRDKEERFGKKAGGAGGSKPNAVVKEPTAIEKFEVAIKQVKIAHPRNIFLDKA